MLDGVSAVAQAERLVIRGGRPLRGRVAVSGSKNAALYALATGLLTAEPVLLHRVPAIADTGEMAALLRDLGAAVEVDGTDVRIEARALTGTAAPAERVAALRASFLVMGPLLGRLGEAACPPPGGDVIGVRPLDVHLAGFRALGADVRREGSMFVARAARLEGARVFFDYPSVLGTVNVLFAAVLARGTTTIVNAAAEPEVAMACALLQAMGARIAGAGGNTLVVEGVEELHGVEFTIIPDRIEAGTYLLAGVATGGDVEVVGAVPEHLDGLVAKLREAGALVEVCEGGLRARRGAGFEAVQLQAVPYPGFATDLHAPMAATLTQARGVSIIHERVFENRLLYVGELRAMGARITTGGQAVMIEGPTPLFGTGVRALDVRAGAAVVIAGLCAEGETVIRDVVHIDRGYAELEPRLRALGADVRRA
jgi:UDP-N-acetylglucosamine 1-carboxyvinyltransferase